MLGEKMKTWKCIEGVCGDCPFDKICKQDGPTKDFTKWLEN